MVLRRLLAVSFCLPTSRCFTPTWQHNRLHISSEAFWLEVSSKMLIEARNFRQWSTDGIAHLACARSVSDSGYVSLTQHGAQQRLPSAQTGSCRVLCKWQVDVAQMKPLYCFELSSDMGSNFYPCG